MPCLIEFNGVTSRSDNGGIVFENAGLMLSSGEKVLISAQSGSGKGEFLKLVAGLIKPDKGEVLLFGEDTAVLSPERLNHLRKKIGFVFQDAVLISNLKVIENVALPLLYHTDLPREDCMKRALEHLDMAGYKGGAWALPGPLPLYAKKEVAIAKALAMEPEIVICENLSAGLNVDELKHLAALLMNYKSKKPESLLIMTAITEADAAFLSPERVLKIENYRFA
ncbi:ATP-binding cassette domain-containing protein [bacterium]|nr:MAG: ATP-binding cassette domain-containing protein [bacterium]